MKIELLHPESSEFPNHAIEWAQHELFPIGIVQLAKDGEFVPLAIAQRGRQRALVAFVDGVPMELDMEDAGPAFFEAVYLQCTATWGHSWNNAVGLIFHVHRQTLLRGRVQKYLLPPRMCMTLAYVFSADDSKELAEMLVAISQYDAWKGTQGMRHVVERYVQAGLNLYYDQDDIATLGLTP
jgi:hypothetical protein